MFRERLPGLTFAVAFLGLLYLIGVMLAPFTPAIVFGLVISGLFWPLRQALIERLHLGRYTTATVVCAIVILSVLLPAVTLTVRLSQEALTLYETVSESFTEERIRSVLFGHSWGADTLRRLFKVAGMKYNMATVQDIVLEQMRQLSYSIFDRINTFAGSILNLFIQFAVMLVLIFGIMTDGPALKTFLLNLSPLPMEDEQMIIDKFNQMSYVTLICNGLGGIIQGLLAGISFWLAGLESTVLWTTVMVIMAFIPVVGMTLIYVPASLVLWARGEVGAALAVFLWCSVVSSAVEHWFKPWFMAGRVEGNSIVVFLAILGGLAVFGVLGIFYGPLVFTLFMTFVQLYHARYVPKEIEDPPVLTGGQPPAPG